MQVFYAMLKPCIEQASGPNEKKLGIGYAGIPVQLVFLTPAGPPGKTGTPLVKR